MNTTSAKAPTKVPNKVFFQRPCWKCKRAVFIEEELFYTIGKEPSRKDKVENHQRQRIFYFHAKCFEEVAGKTYL